MLQEAHVMDADYYRHRTCQRRRVLHMQQVRPVPSQLQSKIAAEANKGDRGNVPYAEPGRHAGFCILHRKVGDKLRLSIRSRKPVQKASDVDLVAREMTANCVGVNSKAHADLPV